MQLHVPGRHKSRLQDHENACAAYEIVITMDAQELVFHINYDKHGYALMYLKPDVTYVGNYMFMGTPLFLQITQVTMYQ